jgi:predicted nucleotidyltransferase
MDNVVEKFIQGISAGGIKEKINAVYLFGSRARQTACLNSDYDFLVISHCPDKAFKDKLYGLVVDVLLETQKVVSLKIFADREFKRLCAMQTPFTQNVLREGIKIG